MKVKVEREEEKFRPVRVEIVIESVVELDALNRIVSLDVTIPDTIRSQSGDKAGNAACNVLEELRAALRKVKLVL